MHYTEITDPDTLLQMAIDQYNSTPVTRSSEPRMTITVEQLISEVEYADGTVEKQFCINEIGAVDKEGKQMTAADFSYASGTNGESKSGYGVTLVCTIYATMRASSVPSADMVTFRCDKVTATIVRGSTVYPGAGSIQYWHQKGNEHKSTTFTSSVATNQTFTLNGNGGFYVSTSVPMAGGLFAQAAVALSNGSELVVQAGIPQDAPFD